MKCPLITFSCFPTETLALYWFLGKQLFIFFNNVPLSVICVSNICPTLCVFSGFTNVLHFKAVKFISLFRLLVFCDSRNPSLRKVKNILIHILSSGASQVALEVKNQPANAGDIKNTGSIPELGRSPGGEHDKPLHYSCLENPMDRGAWQATVHRISNLAHMHKELPCEKKRK